MAPPKERNTDNLTPQSETADTSVSTQSPRRSSRRNQVISPNQEKHESSKTQPAICDDKTLDKLMLDDTHNHTNTSKTMTQIDNTTGKHLEGGQELNCQEKLDSSKTQSCSSSSQAQAAVGSID